MGQLTHQAAFDDCQGFQTARLIFNVTPQVIGQTGDVTDSVANSPATFVPSRAFLFRMDPSLNILITNDVLIFAFINYYYSIVPYKQ